jgi:hypothetical protein
MSEHPPLHMVLFETQVKQIIMARVFNVDLLGQV